MLDGPAATRTAGLVDGRERLAIRTATMAVAAVRIDTDETARTLTVLRRVMPTPAVQPERHPR